ncbi:hypothetical protein [Fulvivirga lutimaris]|uniref:hypothetical protein n=1 Tax=Fulvivirga lutimaris TaxID=1819566 RepID=UPI0012BC664D|nr:hypothetical protein [Fulvivirga lutimaris]MTI39420.1 hypothetical protein [Fulvivirga lutimaris]
MKFNLSTIKKFGYDLLPVAVGVFLALVLNNAQQVWKESSFQEQLLNTVFEENEANKKSITDLLEKQKRTIDTLNHYAKNEEYTVFDLIQKVNGLSTPNLANYGATYLLINNQSLVDVELLLKLAELDSQLKVFQLASDQIVDQLYEDLYNTDQKSKRRISLMLSDIKNYENNIITLGDEFNALYKK